MKNNLRMLGLALCMLPMYLHAGTGQNTRSTERIPAGTILPVSLNSALRSDKGGSGATIIATVMQDVPLGKGETLRKGSKVTGHVVEAITPGNGSDESKISFQFDQVRFGNQTLQITATLRAIASRTAVLAATPTKPSIDDTDEQVEIGGDQISYGEGGPVMVGSQVVGRYTSQGVLANVDQNSGTPRGATSDDDARGHFGSSQSMPAAHTDLETSESSNPEAPSRLVKSLWPPTAKWWKSTRAARCSCV